MAEVNESVIENVSNATNATGRDAATAEGIAITYSSLFLMALLPLFFGSLRSVGYHAGLKVERCRGQRTVMLLILLYFSPQTRGEEAGDRIAMRDAAMFPVYASGGLFGLYLFFKVCACGGGIARKSSISSSQFLPKEYVNMILSVLFLGLGISAVTRAMR